MSDMNVALMDIFLALILIFRDTGNHNVLTLMRDEVVLLLSMTEITLFICSLNKISIY